MSFTGFLGAAAQTARDATGGRLVPENATNKGGITDAASFARQVHEGGLNKDNLVAEGVKKQEEANKLLADIKTNTEKLGNAGPSNKPVAVFG